MHPVWLQRRTGTIQWKTFEIELSLQSHALFCRHQSPEPRKQRLRRPLEPHVTRKKHRVSRPKVFSPREFTRSRTVALPNYLMRGGWHDDVLDMMVWMLSMTIVRNSDAFKLYKLPLINSPNQPHVCHFPKKKLALFSSLLAMIFPSKIPVVRLCSNSRPWLGRIVPWLGWENLTMGN